MVMFFVSWYGDHRYLHVLTHSFPTRLSSDLTVATASAMIAASRSRCSMRSSSRRWAISSGFTGEPPATITPRPQRGPAGRIGTTSGAIRRSEEHTSELQSLMRISYAVFCLKKTNTSKNKQQQQHNHSHA